jgi:hypothetical protein
MLMKFTHVLSSLLLAFIFSLPSFAATRSKEITLSQTTRIGTAELKPGTYRVAWNGNGPDVEVDFLKDRKVVLTTNAKLGHARNERDSINTRRTTPDSEILEELDFKNAQLVFSETDHSSGN